jgi:hypothetical protein
MPPPLADTGGKRWVAAPLGLEEWTSLTARWTPTAIVFTRTDHPSVARYLEWVDRNFEPYRRYSEERRIWVPGGSGR